MSTNPAGATGSQGGNQTFHITNFSPTLTGNLLTVGTFAGLLKVTGKDNQNTGNDFNLKFSGTVVPLPAALPLLGTGLLGLWGIGRMRRNTSEGSAQPA